MSNPRDIITSLQNMLFLKYEITTTQDTTLSNQKNDDPVDVPFVDDDEYITHRPYGETKEIKEQEEEEEEIPTEVPEPDLTTPEIEGGEEAAVEDPAMAGGEEDMGDMGAEAGMGDEMGGMPGEEKEEPLTPGQIGRVYELKKIYTRLSALENMLQDVTDMEMIEVRNLISKAIDLFKTLSANFDVYKEKLDDIIIIFYKFLDVSYKKVRDYFKNNKDNED